MLIITVQNRMTAEAAGKGIRILERTEKDKPGHGYGMKSIRKVVNSYGGSIEADIKGNLFQIKVLLSGFGEFGQADTD